MTYRTPRSDFAMRRQVEPEKPPPPRPPMRLKKRLAHLAAEDRRSMVPDLDWGQEEEGV